MSSRLCVFTEQVGGGDRIWLDGLAIVAGLRYSKTYPGGACTASWQMTLNALARHRAWAPGREVGIACGASTIWRGDLDNPTRGTVWQLSAQGGAADAKRFAALADDDTGSALDLASVLTNANGRGLGWTLPGSFPTVTDSTSPSGSIMCDEALAEVSAGQTPPQFWSVDANRVLTIGESPADSSFILLATTPGGGRTLDQFVTDVIVIYQAATGVIKTVTRSATSRPFGRFEYVLDITAQGLLPDVQAEAAGDAYLATNGARAKFTDPFTVTAGQLLTSGGQPVDLATFSPGVRFNVILTDPDSAGEVTLAPVVSCVAGFTDYDVDSGVLTLGTTDYSGDSLSSGMFAGAA